MVKNIAAVFLLKAVLVYLGIILMSLLVNISPIVSSNFRAYNNKRYNNYFKKTTTVKFEKTKNSIFDTRVHLKYANSKQWTQVEYLVDSWYLVFIPKVLFISLLLATKFKSLKSKIISFAIGLIINTILINFILNIRIYVLRIEAQNILNDFQNSFTDKIMVFFHNNIAVYGWICFVIPLFVWVLVSSRTEMFSASFKLNSSKV